MVTSRSFVFLDGAGGHDPRNRAGIGAEQRDERLAVQAHTAHQAVHDERRASHVACVFKQAEEEEQDQNLRQKQHDSAHAGDRTVREKIAEISGRHHAPDPCSERSNLPVDPVHRILCEREDRQEQHGHDCTQHQPAQERMHDDLVDAVGDRRTGIGSAQHRLRTKTGNRFVAAVDQRPGPIDALQFPPGLPTGQDRGGRLAQGRRTGDADCIPVGEKQQCLGACDQRLFAVVLDQRGLKLGNGWRDRHRDVPAMARQRKVCPAHRQSQLEDALAVRRLAGNNRDAQLVFEPGNAQVKPRSHGEIHHVQHQDHGPAQIEHLMDQIQIPLDIRGIDDADDAVRLHRVGPSAEKDIAHDRLVWRSRGERVRARQINDSNWTPVLRIGGPGLLLDCHARIIPNLLL